MLVMLWPIIVYACDWSFLTVFRWAHVGCAVAMPEVFFVDVNLRETINTSQVTAARRKLVSNTQTVLFNLASVKCYMRS